MGDAAKPLPDLATLGRRRDELLDRILRALEADPRVAAVWLSGSFGRSEDDAWSDLDLHVAVQDEHLEAFLAERPALYARAGRPVLIQGEIPSNAMNGAHFQLVLYAGPVEVDWNIGPLSQAERPPASQLLFDRAGVPLMRPPSLTPDERQARATEALIFFWAMAPIAVKFAGRGETHRVGRLIELMTNAYISLWRLVHQPDGPEPYLPHLNRPLEPELDTHLPMLGERIDSPEALAVIRALCAAAERLHPALAALDVPIPDDVPGEVSNLATLAEAIARRGDRPRRPFR
jgi:predicted nucleotidyltransferase